jgi:hypothetical protein
MEARNIRSVGAPPASTPTASPPLLRDRQYSRRQKERHHELVLIGKVQDLNRNQRRATEQVDRMRPPAGAPVETIAGTSSR